MLPPHHDWISSKMIMFDDILRQTALIRVSPNSSPSVKKSLQGSKTCQWRVWASTVAQSTLVFTSPLHACLYCQLRGTWTVGCLALKWALWRHLNTIYVEVWTPVASWRELWRLTAWVKQLLSAQTVKLHSCCRVVTLLFPPSYLLTLPNHLNLFQALNITHGYAKSSRNLVLILPCSIPTAFFKFCRGTVIPLI